MLDTIIETFGGNNSIWWLGGGYFAMIIGERLYHLLTNTKAYNDKDALCSIGLNMISTLVRIGIGILVPLVAYVWVYDHARWMSLDHVWLALLIAFVVHELSYYWEHRISHRVGLFWAIHAIHHSSNEYNHTTAARGFAFGTFLRTPFDCVAALLGVPPVVFYAVSALKNLYGIWNHASYVGDLGLLERIFATPQNHKVHHANQPQYIDKNYSQVLIIWDRLFGTFEPYKEAPFVGLINAVHDNNPLTAQFAGFAQLWAKMKRTENWRIRFAYLWRPPEWSHDGVCVSDCPKYAAAPKSVTI